MSNRASQLAVAVLFTLLWHVALSGNAEAAPNVVILIADDLGWADVGYHGSDIETLNIDSLAADGLQLDRLYVSPSCTPTRAGLMTGRDPIRLGVGWFPILPWSNKAISPEERFVAQDFQEAGYQTGMVGKWHVEVMVGNEGSASGEAAACGPQASRGDAKRPAQLPCRVREA